MNTILNLQSHHFNELGEDPLSEIEPIHLRVYQRNARKRLTTVSGINEKYELKKLVRTWRKYFSCSGSIKKTKQGEKYIELFGDQREGVEKYLIKNNIANKEQIKIHGY